MAGCAPSILDPMRHADKANSTALFVISRHDRLAPPETQEAVAQLYGGTARVLHVDGGHDSPALEAQDQPRYREAVRLLWKTV
jgi:pimeloyl-ACP methyl ester carboxylesterase